jgi:hypothetical protein
LTVVFFAAGLAAAFFVAVVLDTVAFLVVGLAAAGVAAVLAGTGFAVTDFFAVGVAVERVMGFFATGFGAVFRAAGFGLGGATIGRSTTVPSFLTVFGAVVASGDPSDVLPLTGSCRALGSGRLVMWSSSYV